MLKIISANINIVLAFILGYNAVQLLLQINSIPLVYNYTGHSYIANKLHSSTSKLDITTLSNAYLFGNTNVLTTHIATQIKSPILPDTKLNLKLQGIYHGSTSYAAIMLNDIKSFYQAGDSLPNGTILHAIFPKKVILLRDGNYETLRFMGNKDNKVNRFIRKNAKSKPEKLLAEYQRQLKHNPQQLTKLVRISAVNRDGKLLGYRIKPKKDTNLLSQFNLKTGDILTTVNGVKLNSPLKALGLIQKLATTDKVEFEVLRNGQKVFLSFDVER
ncbi:type II secretion system protein GspC [Candidatus Halobeggiatoa sp. HSG11]|nr:type II secretion system protein GspC [Candidatus Halobeggiatoa sp. HSG11]